jgi:hypothetical protein
VTPEERAERCWDWRPVGASEEHITDAIAREIREAVQEEREACAKTAMRAIPLPREGFTYPCDWLHETIAANIRNRE